MSTLDQDGVTTLLGDWLGSQVEVLVRGRDTKAWLARFGGKLEEDDGGGTFLIDAGGPEAWVQVAPPYFEEAELVKDDVLVVRHRDGEVTVRKA